MVCVCAAGTMLLSYGAVCAACAILLSYGADCTAGTIATKLQSCVYSWYNAVRLVRLCVYTAAGAMLLGWYGGVSTLQLVQCY